MFAGPIRNLRSARQPGAAATAWRSAILKSRCDAPVQVGALGLAGDAQKEKKHHGGPTKAVLVYGAAPAEFGAACAFLCAARSGFMTGQNLQLDGGAYAGLV